MITIQTLSGALAEKLLEVPCAPRSFRPRNASISFSWALLYSCLLLCLVLLGSNIFVFQGFGRLYRGGVLQSFGLHACAQCFNATPVPRTDGCYGWTVVLITAPPPLLSFSSFKIRHRDIAYTVQPTLGHACTACTNIHTYAHTYIIITPFHRHTHTHIFLP